MKDIIYRAKEKTTNEWIYGLPISNDVIRCFDGKEYVIDVNTLGKSTGYPDKDGKECFEGDLIPYIWDDKKIGIVRYGDYRNIFDDKFSRHIGFYVEWQDKSLKLNTRIDLGYWLELSKISGNIYDNKVI